MQLRRHEIKNKIDLEKLFSHLKWKEVDSAKEEACQNRLIEFFSGFPREETKTKTFKYTRLIYASASFLVICIIVFSISFSLSQITQAKIITQTFIQKEFKNDTIAGIFVDLLRSKSTVDLTTKHVVFNLKSKTVDKIIQPYSIELSIKEKNFVIEILHKGRYPFFAYKDSDDPNTIIAASVEISLGVDEKVYLTLKSKNGIEPRLLFEFYSTDEIVRIDGFQYPDTNNKEAYVEVKSDQTKGYKAIIVVDLGKKEIKGPHVERVEEIINQKK